MAIGRFTVLSICLVGVLPVFAGAQPTRRMAIADSVPIELAIGLAGGGGFSLSGNPQILIGSMPGWVTQRVTLPAEAHILGAAVVDQTVVGVLTLPASDTVVQHLRQLWDGRGWSSPPARPVRPGSNAPNGPAPSDQLQLCSDDARTKLTATRERDHGASSTIVLRLAPAGDCRPVVRR